MSPGLFPDFSSTESIVRYFVSICLQAGLFLASFVFLNRFLFKPVMNVLRSRHSNIDELEEKTGSLEKENEVLEEEYNWRVEGAKQLAVEKREMSRLMGRRRAEMILTEVKRETGRDLKNVKKSTEYSTSTVSPTMAMGVEKFSKEIVEKIIS